MKELLVLVLMVINLPLILTYQVPDTWPSECLSIDNNTCLTSIKELNTPDNSGYQIRIKYGCATGCTSCCKWLNLTTTLNLTSSLISNLTSDYQSTLYPSCNSCVSNLDYKFNITFVDPVTDLSNLTTISINYMVYETNKTYSEVGFPTILWISPNWYLKRSLLQLNNTLITWNMPNLHIISTDIDLTDIIVTIRTANLLVDCSYSPCDFEIPAELLTVDATMYVQAYYNSQPDNNYTFQIKKADTCTIDDCIFICKSYFTHFVCYSTTTQIIVGTAFTLSLATIVIVLGLLFRCCFNSYWMREYLMKMRKDYIRRTYPENQDSGEVLSSDISTSTEVETIPTRSKRKSSNMAKFLAILMLCCLASPISAECIGTTTQITQVTECINTQATTVCSMNVNLQAILPNIGSSLCITFKDTLNNVPVGTMKLTLTAVRMRAALSHQYFTSDWALVSCSSKYCPTTTSWCSDSCVTLSSSDTSMLSGICTTLPGVTQCQTSCGCAGCGCVFCSDACLYSRYAFQPYNGAWRVSSVVSMDAEPVITMELDMGEIQRTDIIDLTQSQLIVGNFTIINLGEISLSPSLFGGKKVINSNTQAYMYTASELGSPDFGVPGDIQSNFHEFLETQPYYFDFPTSLVPSIQQPDRIVYAPPTSGIQRMLTSGTLFPFTLNNILWGFTPNALIGFDTAPQPVLITVSSNQNLQFTLNVSKVCPHISDLRVNGCFLCSQGASIVITARSSCDVGSAILKVETGNLLITTLPSVYLSTEDSEITIPIFSNDKSITGLVRLTYLDLTATRDFSGVLDNPPQIDPSQINFTGTPFETKPLDEQTFTEWWNSLTGPLSIAKYVIAVVLGLVSLTLVVLFIVGGFKLTNLCLAAYQNE